MTKLNSKFTEDPIVLINSKNKKYRLFYALFFKYYEIHSEFFIKLPKFSGSLITNISNNLKLSRKIAIPSGSILGKYRKEIRNYFGVNKESCEKLMCNYVRNYLSTNSSFKVDIEQVETHLKKNRIERPHHLEQIISKSVKKYEGEVFNEMFHSLTSETKAYLNGLLIMENNNSIMSWIKSWLQGISLKSILAESEKLKHLKNIELSQIVNKIPIKQQRRYYRNICTKYPNAIKQMPQISKYVLLALFCSIRCNEITDNLIDMLLRFVQKIFLSGESKIKKKLANVANIKANYSSKKLLKLLIKTILSHEDKVIKDAIFEVVPKVDLVSINSSLLKENITYEGAVYEKARKSYVHHYRQIFKPVLELLDFHTNNKHDEKIIEGLKIIKDHLSDKTVYFSKDLSVPVNKVIKKCYRHLIVNDDGRVNRANYELALLYSLKDKLKVKEVWVGNSYKYRNPEEDLPQDFEAKKEHYFELVDKPLNGKRFTREIKQSLLDHLSAFNTSLPKNKLVKILKKPKRHIKVAKLTEQAKPQKLDLIKQELFNKWPSVNLLDILKETDLFVNFTDDFVASGPKEGLSKDEVRKRVLLAILEYGTNTGLKSMSTGNDDVTYKDLLHIKLRYFDPDNLRAGIRKIVNSLLEIQSPEIWSNCTTSVASDSTHFKSSDQNLMSRWHPRYHSTGVLVYWHVDHNSVCIYSQLKSCAASEVSSMIEGVLRHSTDKVVDKNYVDTHGASEIGFAFSHLLGFELLPRLKNIHSQKLYYSEKGDQKNYENLTDILAKPIDWEIIEQYYDEIIKYIVALKQGRADAENIMRRFTRKNSKHPVYKLLRELGRVIKSIFLCKYLSSEKLRQEIHENLNIVER